jgi:hypothetical protein
MANAIRADGKDNTQIASAAGVAQATEAAEASVTRVHTTSATPATPGGKPGGVRVGLVYGVREPNLTEGYTRQQVAEFDRLDTITAIETTLAGLGYACERIGHVRQLAARLVAEGSSKGLTHACRVDTPAALSAACAQLWAQFDQPLLIEPFLSGREFTVGLVGTGAGARVLAVGEMVFCEPSGGIYSYEAKGAPGEPGYGYATLLAHIMAGALERAPRSRHAHHASHAGGDPGA